MWPVSASFSSGRSANVSKQVRRLQIETNGRRIVIAIARECGNQALHAGNATTLEKPGPLRATNFANCDFLERGHAVRNRCATCSMSSQGAWFFV